MRKLNVWNASLPAEEALNLPKGSVAANFGFLCEVSFNKDQVIEAAEHLVANNWEGKGASQAKVLVEAQKLGALQNLAPLQVV